VAADEAVAADAAVEAVEKAVVRVLNHGHLRARDATGTLKKGGCL
jgi:hypothetical protein